MGCCARCDAGKSCAGHKPAPPPPPAPSCGCAYRNPGRLELNRAALRHVLGTTELTEALERKTEGQIGVNAGQIWQYFTRNIYQSSDLPVIATREALQNAADAIRRAQRERKLADKAGKFSVEWDAENHSITWTDNGVGMDEPTLINKFLSLGDSGKNDAGDSSEAAGGFGVAKAVILGTSRTFRWDIHTRDNRAVSTAGGAYEITDAPHLQGSRLTVYDVDPRFDRYYDPARQTAVGILERLRLVLGANDLPFMSLFLNGEEIRPLFSRRGGTVVAQAEGIAWGEGTTVQVKGYRRSDKQGAYYIRLGGLIQFARPPARRLRADIVVDITTTLRPGAEGYPLNAARDALKDTQKWALMALAEQIEEEDESTGRATDYEIFGPDDEPGLTAEATDALKVPEVGKALSEVFGAVADFEKAMDQLKLTSDPVDSSAPAGAPPERKEVVFSNVDVLRDFLDKITEVPASQVVGAIEIVDRAQAGATITSSEAARVDAVIQLAAGTGVLTAMAAPVAQAALDKLAPAGQAERVERRKASPFGAFLVRRNKRRYTSERARRFRQSLPKYLPLLAVWEATLKLCAAAGRVRRKFSAGYVLDDGVEALTAVENYGEANERNVIYIHPDLYRKTVQAHRQRPLALAVWILNRACHELTHLDGRMGEGHGEGYVRAREDLADVTVHLLPAIVAVCSKILGTPGVDAEAGARADKIADQLAACRADLARSKVAAPEVQMVTIAHALMRLRPPEDLTAQDVDDYFNGNRSALLRMMRTALGR